MAKTRDEDREAIIYVAAGVPYLLNRLLWSYLRMKRQAVKAEKSFYRSLRRSGVPKHEAKELAWEYTSVLSLPYWIKQVAFPSAIQGVKKGMRKREEK